LKSVPHEKLCESQKMMPVDVGTIKDGFAEFGMVSLFCRGVGRLLGSTLLRIGPAAEGHSVGAGLCDAGFHVLAQRRRPACPAKIDRLRRLMNEMAHFVTNRCHTPTPHGEKKPNFDQARLAISETNDLEQITREYRPRFN
jgi:hypothetical protein